MPDARRRIIVDGLEPGALVRFPLILRGAASAFQPPRLLVAAGLLLALILPGRVWDAVRGPRLADGELLGRVDASQLEREAEVRRRILVRWAPLAEVPEPAGPGAVATDEAVRRSIETLDLAWTRWRETGRIAATATAESEAAAGDASAAAPTPTTTEGLGDAGAAGGVDAPAGAGATDTGDPGSPPGSSEAFSMGRGPRSAVRGVASAGRAVEPAADAGDSGTGSPASDADAEPLSEARYRSDRRALVAQRRIGEFLAVERAVHESIRTVAAGVLRVDPATVFAGVRQLFVDLPLGAWRHAPVMASVFSPLLLAVWAIGGGALSRMSAMFVARGERATVRTAVGFARQAWGSLLLAPVVPIGAAVLALVPAILAGVLLLVPGLDLVGGLLYGPAIVAAVLAAVLLVGLAIGAPMVTAVIAVERCDAIDAAQRPYAFLFKRPVHMAGYLAMAVLSTAVAYLVAAGVGGVALDLAASAASVAGGSPAVESAGGPPLLGPDRGGSVSASGGTAAIAAAMVGLWRELLLLLVAAAVVSAWASATTAAYLLLRQACDGQDPEEIWEPGMVPGTFARRAPAPPDDHGVAPREQPETADAADDVSGE